MFKPGNYSCAVNVGYYTQIIGLGATPSETVISELYAPDDAYDHTALNNFWRGVENIEVGHGQSNVMWHVS